MPIGRGARTLRSCWFTRVVGLRRLEPELRRDSADVGYEARRLCAIRRANPEGGVRPPGGAADVDSLISQLVWTVP